jgi:hypothetical protein
VPGSIRGPGAGVLAALWPQYQDTLTARPPDDADPHTQARELLTGHDIPVPAAFTSAQMGWLAGSRDARLVLAARSAPDGQVTQFLAGAPELLARYRNAPPPSAALISAAMDARRLGMGADLPPAPPSTTPVGVARLLGGLRAAGAAEQAAALADRLPGAGMFGLFLEQQGGQDRSGSAGRLTAALRAELGRPGTDAAGSSPVTGPVPRWRRSRPYGGGLA